MSTAMGEKDKEIDAVQKEIDERSAALKIIFDKASGDREVTQKLFKERDALRKQVGDKIDERNKLRETFREDNNKWYNYQRAVRKQKQMKYEEDKKVREEVSTLKKMNHKHIYKLLCVFETSSNIYIVSLLC